MTKNSYIIGTKNWKISTIIHRKYEQKDTNMKKTVSLLLLVFMVYPATSCQASGPDLYAYYTRLDYRIPLSEIRDGPAGRSLALDNVAGVMLFASSPAKPRRICIGNMRLEE